MCDPVDAVNDLHRRYDGLITEDMKNRALGKDLRLMEARGAVRFWRDQYDDAREAYRTSTAGLERKMQLVDNVVFARGGLAKAETRLAELEGPTEPSPAAFYKHLGSSI